MIFCKMGLVRSMAKDMIKEIGNKSREFYEFVLPPIDMYLDDKSLTVVIDVPGFAKKDIKLSLNANILSIKAERKNEDQSTAVCKQRPNIIDKRIRLPIRIKEGEEPTTSAKFSDGVLTVVIPVQKHGKDITIE